MSNDAKLTPVNFTPKRISTNIHIPEGGLVDSLIKISDAVEIDIAYTRSLVLRDMMSELDEKMGIPAQNPLTLAERCFLDARRESAEAYYKEFGYPEDDE